MKNFIITGVAGFIGYHLAIKLLKKGHCVYGVDTLEGYFDYKNFRLKNLKKFKNFFFYKKDISKNIKFIKKIIEKKKINTFLHLAAVAGVRNSFHSPKTYLQNNIDGFSNIIEIVRECKIKHLIFASSSSVYGDTKKFPLNEKSRFNNIKSIYALTKEVNERIAEIYAQIYNIKISGLRFFTVYGPWGRPDMATLKFIKKISEKKIIDVYNNGNHFRDFTFIDDAIKCIDKIINKRNFFKNKFEIFNISGNKKIKLLDFIKFIEKNIKIKAKIKFLKLQAGDVKTTEADLKKIKKLGVDNFLDINSGIKKTVDWYQKLPQYVKKTL